MRSEFIHACVESKSLHSPYNVENLFEKWLGSKNTVCLVGYLMDHIATILHSTLYVK